MSNDSMLTNKREILIKELLNRYGLDTIVKNYEDCKNGINTTPYRNPYGYYGNPVHVWNQVYNHVLNIQMYKLILEIIYNFNTTYTLENPQTKFDDFRIYLEKHLYQAKLNNIIGSFKTTVNDEMSGNRYYNSYYYNQSKNRPPSKYILNVHYSFDKIEEGKKSYGSPQYVTIKILDSLNLVNNGDSNSIHDWYLV